MEKEVIEGYGPAGLVEQVRKSVWRACAPRGKNFTGIALAGYLLTDPSDAFCPVKFRVTLEEISEGDRFVVEGYNSENFLDTLRRREHPTTFAGHRLLDAPNGNAKAYRATVERVH